MTRPAAAAAPSSSGVAADLRLPRPPGIFRRFWARHPFVVDGILAGVYGLPAFILTGLLILIDVMGVSNFELPNVGELSGYTVFALGMTLAILFRRRFPLWGVGLAALALLTGLVSQASSPIDLYAIGVILYSVPLYRKMGISWVAYGSLVLAVLLGELVRHGLAEALPATLSAAVLLALVLLVGINTGNRRRYLVAVIDRAAQLARERDQQSQLAAVEERARIAREMHDIVAHSLSVMIALADGAAAAATRNTEAAQKAMLSSAETGRSALAEMRRLLGVLSVDRAESDESVERVPQPGTEDIAGLVKTFRSAGLTVRYSVAGQPTIDRGQQLAVYRVVQESLTNSLRYAGVGATVDIALQFRATETHIMVVDDGADTPTAGNLGSGRGLAGIRQRVEIFGGEVVAAAFGTGWRVNATIPVSSDAFDTASLRRGPPEA